MATSIPTTTATAAALIAFLMACRMPYEQEDVAQGIQAMAIVGPVLLARLRSEFASGLLRGSRGPVARPSFAG